MKKRIFLIFISVLIIICSLPAGAAEKPNVAIIYEYLTETMKLNSAAACGVLANIENESSFNPNTLGDNGTSYGICQWHDVDEGVGRWTSLKNFCSERELDYTQLIPQLMYLEFELQNNFPYVWGYINSVENTEQGAYDAAYYWCYRFEIPADTENRSIYRGEVARDKYFPLYYAPAEEVNHEVWTVNTGEEGQNLNVRTGPDTTYRISMKLENGTSIKVTETVTTGNSVWGKIPGGWCSLEYCDYVSGSLHQIDFDLHIGATVSPVPHNTKGPTPLPFDEITRYGFILEGWATEPGGEIVYRRGNPYTGNGSATLHAVWSRDDFYELTLGDVNCDENVNAVDAVLILRYLVGFSLDITLESADMDGNGKVNTVDVILILRSIANEK